MKDEPFVTNRAPSLEGQKTAAPVCVEAAAPSGEIDQDSHFGTRTFAHWVP
jgi:hypothetical protein